MGQRPSPRRSDSGNSRSYSYRDTRTRRSRSRSRSKSRSRSRSRSKEVRTRTKSSRVPSRSPSREKHDKSKEYANSRPFSKASNKEKPSTLNVEIHPLLMNDESLITNTKSSSMTSSRLPMAATSSVMANIKAGEKSILQTSLSTVAAAARTPVRTPAEKLLAIKPPIDKRNPYFDRSLPSAGKVHRPRPIKFIQQGTFVAEAEHQRAIEDMESLRREVAESLGKVGIDSEIVADLMTSDMIPTMEWWDRPFLVDKDYQIVNDLIQRPALLPPPLDIVVEPKPLLLTAEERKKLRRQRRLAEHREQQEKIKLGLLPPPPAKTRIANIAKVLGTRAVPEPSRVEAEIRAAATQRHQLHLQANLQRKEEAASKENVASAIKPATLLTVVFKISHLEAPQWRFKVTKNAQQYGVSGCALYYEGCNLVIAEGGETAIRRYKHLLLDRIKWNQPPMHSSCQLIWEGIVRECSFRGFIAQTMATELDAVEFLSKFGLEHYWRAASRQ